MNLNDKYFKKMGIYISKGNKSFLIESAGIIYVDKYYPV